MIIVFVLLRVVPGDPVAMMMADVDASGLSQGELVAVRKSLGLDKPVPEQFVTWLVDVSRGDLGRSITTREPVTEIIASRAAMTVQLAVVSLMLAAMAAVILGAIAAWKHGSRYDQSFVAAITLLQASPAFWTGMVLILIFGIGLQWLPVMGSALGSHPFWGSHMIMPVVTLALAEVPVIARATRTALLEVAGRDYILHARAKGLSERQVLLRHALPSAAPTIVTVIGLKLGDVLGGAAVIETMFGIAGMGRLLVDGIYQRDYPVIQGCVLFIAICYIAANLAVDAVNGLLDPRVKG